MVHLQEASWHEPALRPMFDPGFLRRYEEPSRLAAERAATIITPSESSRRQILGQYRVDPSRVHVVPLGVDLGLFRPARPGAAAIIARAGGDPARPYVLFVSTLHPRKNLGALRSAMTGLAQRGFPHSLVIAASPPPDRDDSTALFKEAAAELPGAPGRVVLLGGLSDVELAAVMAGAEVFCLPSLMEGFGLTALEAMACGVPVVVSDRGSLPEVAGDVGVVTAPCADAIEAALDQLLSSPPRMKELSRAGLERSLQFTWQATAQGWLRALEQTVAPRPVSVIERLVPSTGVAAEIVRHGFRLPIRRRRSIQHRRSAG